MAHLHSVYDNDTHFSINPTTRVITNTTAKSKLVQFDHNSERFTFEIPRFVEGHDMTLCDKVEIHYINVSGNKNEQSTDVYLVDDMQTSPADDSVAIFSWLISANATKHAGILSFLIKFVCLDGKTVEYAWNTDVFSDITIASGMDNGESVIAEYSDVLEAWRQEVLFGANGAMTEIAAAKAAMLKEIELAAEIAQTTGESETAVMSQKAVKDNTLSLDSDGAYIIPDGTDFDTLTTRGNYKVRTWSSGSTMINTPNQNAGRLIVMCTSEHEMILQVYVANTSEHFIYTRLKDGSLGWSDWVSVVTSDVTDELTKEIDRCLSLESDDAFIIADGTDFDTLTEPRTYKVRTWSSGSTMKNTPNQNAGRLIVMRTSEWERILQVYIANTDEHFIYVRINYGSAGWTDWASVVTSDVTDELNRKIANLESGRSYPAYYDDMLTEKVRKINGEMLSLGFCGGDAFVFVTDTHEKPTYTAETMQHICDNTNISTIVHGGDSAKDKTTKTEALEVINKYYNHYRLNGCTLYKVVGNHEFNNGGARDEYADRQLSENELFMTILGDNANHVTYDPTGTLAYYFDNPAQKMRYFVNSVNYKSTPSWQGVNWILAELENVPTDYDVVLFCHHVIGSNGEYKSYMERLVGGLDAYKAHTTYVNDYTKEMLDYTQKSGEVICVCVGDEHVDVSKISSGGIPIIATTCATYNEELGGLDRTLGTVNEGAYDVYVINKNTRKINITRIGAGSDREFTY